MARLAFAPLGAVRLLGCEGLLHELHRVRNLAGVIHLQLDVAVAPEPEIGDVGGKPARVGDVVEAHVEAEQKPALLRHDVCEVGARLVGDVVPRELFADLRRQREDLLPDRFEEVVHRRAGTQMRVMLDGVVAGAGARGPVRFKDTVGEDRTLPDLDRVVSETRAAGADGIAVPALRLPQIGVQAQWAVAVSLLGIALVAEGPVAHLRVEGGEGQVAEGTREGRLWNEFIARYHYLGYKTLVGAQMRYAVHDRNGWPLAMLGFSTAAWKLASRDNFIGWTPEMREKNLSLVVDNPRFLILPWVEIPNLGSHVLALVRRRLPQDWAERYNTTPVLIETFVETPRYTGAVYKASGWIPVGTTQGRGRYDRHTKRDQPKKDIWLRPLRKDWKRTLNR